MSGKSGKTVMTPDALTVWLALTQSYRTNPQAVQRIKGSVDGLNRALAKPAFADSLFWTEPTNLDSLLKSSSPDTDRDE